MRAWCVPAEAMRIYGTDTRNCFRNVKRIKEIAPGGERDSRRAAPSADDLPVFPAYHRFSFPLQLILEHFGTNVLISVFVSSCRFPRYFNHQTLHARTLKIVFFFLLHWFIVVSSVLT